MPVVLALIKHIILIFWAESEALIHMQYLQKAPYLQGTMESNGKSVVETGNLLTTRLELLFGRTWN
jgi:glucose-6-phosphate isomerase